MEAVIVLSIPCFLLEINDLHYSTSLISKLLHIYITYQTKLSFPQQTQMPSLGTYHSGPEINILSVKFKDQKTYGGSVIRKIIEELKNIGINEFCDEKMTNGITGEPIKCLIFVGVCYYQRLKHMVIDKVHARSRGGRTRMTRQPREGRMQGGGFRVGHMERDCLSSGTPVALREGISLPIEQFRSETVWGWTGEGLEKSSQSDFAYKGILSRFTVTLQDGRQIHATRNHPFLTENGDWADLKDLRVNKDRLVCSVNPPLADFEKENIEVRKWGQWSREFFSKLRGDKPSYYEVFRRCLSLTRVVGLMIINGDFEGKTVSAYLDHLLDVESFIDDIERLTGIRPKWKMVSSRYQINLPCKLSHSLRRSNVQIGPKARMRPTLPNFINERTPVCIVREFLGGMFGKNGRLVRLSKHRGKRDSMKTSGLAISWVQIGGRSFESLKRYIVQIQSLLKKCGVRRTTIQKPKLTTASKRSNRGKVHREIVLNIPLESLIAFSEKVGFRYCVYKSQQLEVGVSYRRFWEGVFRQKTEIVKRANEIYYYKRQAVKENLIRINKVIKQAVEELKEREPLIHSAAIPTGKIFGRLALGKNNSPGLRSTIFPTAEEYLIEIGAIDFFSNDAIVYGVSRGRMTLPSYHLRILDIRENGTEKMYDITVKGAESFVANGIVSHNCLLGQGAPWFAKDRLMEQSDETRVWFCRICGLQALVTAGDPKRRFPPRRECRVCESNQVVLVKMPYATKLLMQELAGMNVVIRVLPTAYGKPGDTALIKNGKKIIGKGIIVKSQN